jgi:hypothetical protein
MPFVVILVLVVLVLALLLLAYLIAKRPAAVSRTSGKKRPPARILRVQRTHVAFMGYLTPTSSLTFSVRGFFSSCSLLR